MAGNRRFEKILKAAREGQTTAPVDLRYLSRPKESVKDDEVRADVASFLEQLYTSCAETLPDVRDDPLTLDEQRELEAAPSKAELVDPYAEKLDDVRAGKAIMLPSKESSSKRKIRKGVKINAARMNEEVRYLPPGTMKDHWEQYRLVSRCNSKASFVTFWRVPGTGLSEIYCNFLQARRENLTAARLPQVLHF